MSDVNKNGLNKEESTVVPYKGTYYGIPCEITSDGSFILGEDGKRCVAKCRSYIGNFDSPLYDGEVDFGPSLFVPDLPKENYCYDTVVRDGRPVVENTSRGVNKVITKGRISLEGDATCFFSPIYQDWGFDEAHNGVFGRVEEMDLSALDTSKVTTMRGMFADCTDLKSLTLSHFNMSNVTDASFMFADCDNLQSLDLSYFDMSKVTDVSFMFGGCKNLETLNLTGWNSYDFKHDVGMYDGCDKVQVIKSSESVLADEESKSSSKWNVFKNISGKNIFDVKNATNNKVIRLFEMNKPVYMLVPDKFVKNSNSNGKFDVVLPEAIKEIPVKRLGSDKYNKEPVEDLLKMHDANLRFVKGYVSGFNAAKDVFSDVVKDGPSMFDLEK